MNNKELYNHHYDFVNIHNIYHTHFLTDKLKELEDNASFYKSF